MAHKEAREQHDYHASLQAMIWAERGHILGSAERGVDEGEFMGNVEWNPKRKVWWPQQEVFPQ
jgi:hypothetical protein